MPKRGIRKIVVNNKTYKYVIKFSGVDDDSMFLTKLARVTIESPEGKYYRDERERYRITPAYVKKLINRKTF